MGPFVSMKFDSCFSVLWICHLVTKLYEDKNFADCSSTHEELVEQASGLLGALSPTMWVPAIQTNETHGNWNQAHTNVSCCAVGVSLTWGRYLAVCAGREEAALETRTESEVGSLPGDTIGDSDGLD